ncbi:MAG: tetratricopeptide repeat protein [Anaerolineaceae bacterium]|nr:tetratricopeptide repeat protein [Anaerolineaceae bacterium]
MAASDFIVNVNEASFEYDVVAYSQNTPVVVDFWAEWCRPCKVLEPVLEHLVHEANGAFRLARVNVDESPNLAIRYSVRSIPTVKAFSSGEVVGEFTGAQPEPRVREFINKITPPSPLTLALEKAASTLVSQNWGEAESQYRSLLSQNPDNPGALLGLALSLLPQGKGFEAQNILQAFPASREFARAELLLPLAEAQTAYRKGILPVEEDLDAAYANSIHLSTKGNLPAALDGLLDIMRQSKNYHNGAARRLILSILELFNQEDEQVRQYRSELASILF